MATITPTIVDDGSFVQYTWNNMAGATSDVGAPMRLPSGDYELCVQTIGTLGTSTVTWQGSLDNGTTWGALDDVGGTAISANTELGIIAVGARPPIIRPAINAGNGTGLKLVAHARKVT